jgi:hypothetical protein
MWRKLCDRGRALPQSQISLTFWALCIDPPLAKLIRGGWFAKGRRHVRAFSRAIRELLDFLYRVDSGRILATLIRLLGDFDLAEEAEPFPFLTPKDYSSSFFFV